MKSIKSQKSFYLVDRSFVFHIAIKENAHFNEEVDILPKNKRHVPILQWNRYENRNIIQSCHIP